MHNRITNKKNLVPVSVGNLVRAVFYHYTNPEERERIGVVTKIKRRYGHHGSFTRTSPLLYVQVEGSEELEIFDQSFVVEVMKRGQKNFRSYPENVFRTDGMGDLGYWRPLKRGVWMGTLLGLTCRVLAGLPFQITHPLDEDKLNSLFTKSGLSYVGEHRLFKIKSEPFKRWVKQNYSKFLCTTAELDAVETKVNRELSHELDVDFDLLGESEGRESEGSCYDY